MLAARPMLSCRVAHTCCWRVHQLQVAAGVMPRLQQGWYFLLAATAGGPPVCLVAHTPSSHASTRITMVYTPAEHRGKGHAKAAGELQLELG